MEGWMRYGKRNEDNCSVTAIFIPTPVLSGSGSMGLISVCYSQTPLKRFRGKGNIFFEKFLISITKLINEPFVSGTIPII